MNKKIKQKDFKEMCIRLGLADDNLKIDYNQIAILMWLGKQKVCDTINKEKYPHAVDSYEQDLRIINEYIE